ncbi:3-mercaptopyruvate sulfurtransferase [Cereibacter sp. SYSU M97828]|nr:3-mercaptopyruvate sulfurtransferase [Cereibacter flavus]
MTLELPGPLVSTEWLAEHLSSPELVLLDASFAMPGATPTAPDIHAAGHIPGARFFDIDGIADPGSPLPHMLPSPEDFAAVAESLGIHDGAPVVIYDATGLMSAPRAWWTLRVFGHENVAILNGGFRKWRAEGRTETTEPAPPKKATFTPRFRPELVRSRQDVLANLDTAAAQVIDARAADRFEGTAPEPRPGIRSGHIPGSLNLPFAKLSDPATGEVLPPEALAQRFREAGLDPHKPVITSCGSGVTAGVLAFTLSLLGRDDVAVYDGSWSEWGREGDTPVATGKA